MFAAVAHSRRQCELDIQLFDDLLSAFRQDVETRRYAAYLGATTECFVDCGLPEPVIVLGAARHIEWIQRGDAVRVRFAGDMRPVAEALAAMPEVDYVVLTAGSFDLLVEVVCADEDHLITLLNEQIRTLPGVSTTETFVYLKLHGQRYDWGTR